MKAPTGNNERGRITGMAGTETSVALHPQRLGVRMRNNIIRMLEKCVLEGGWSSHSRKLAEALAEKYELQVSTNNWNGLRIIGLSAEAAPCIREVVVADWTAWLLENSSYGSGYYHNLHKKAIEHIDNRDQNFYVTIHDKVSVRKVIEILATHTTQEAKDKSKYVADLLRGTKPIHLITFRE